MIDLGIVITCFKFPLIWLATSLISRFDEVLGAFTFAYKARISGKRQTENRELENDRRPATIFSTSSTLHATILLCLHAVYHCLLDFRQLPARGTRSRGKEEAPIFQTNYPSRLFIPHKLNGMRRDRSMMLSNG